MRLPRYLLPCLLTVLGGVTPLLGGCSSGAGSLTSVVACYYDFSAELDEGSAAGLSLRGTLLLFERAGGGVSASFIPGGTNDLLRVPARLSQGSVELEFTVPDGTVTATGRLGKSPEDCSAPLEGTLAGPGDEDSGSWTGTGRCAGDGKGCSGELLVSGAEEPTCSAACGEAGHDEATCTDFCGTR